MERVGSGGKKGGDFMSSILMDRGGRKRNLVVVAAGIAGISLVFLGMMSVMIGGTRKRYDSSEAVVSGLLGDQMLAQQLATLKGSLADVVTAALDGDGRIAPEVLDQLLKNVTKMHDFMQSIGVGSPSYQSEGYIDEPMMDVALLTKSSADRRRSVPSCVNNLGKPGGFLLITSAHTGSTAFLSQLVQHPNVHWNMETFEPLNKFDYEELNPSGAAEWARTYFSDPDNSPEGKITGFKISPVTIIKAPKAFQALVRDFNLRIIWNYRSNMFKRSVGRYPSYFLGDKSNTISGISKTGPVDGVCKLGEGCSFAVEKVKDLHCLMLRNYKVDEYVNKAVSIVTEDHKCYAELEYEDFFRNPDETLNRVFSFLGVEPYKTEPTREKATSNNMCAVVDNYFQVCAAFSQCNSWKWMLEDSEEGCSCSDYTYISMGSDEDNPLCNVVKPDDYHRWCGGFNYEQDSDRIKNMQSIGEYAIQRYKAKASEGTTRFAGTQ